MKLVDPQKLADELNDTRESFVDVYKRMAEGFRIMFDQIDELARKIQDLGDEVDKLRKDSDGM